MPPTPSGADTVDDVTLVAAPTEEGALIRPVVTGLAANAGGIPVASGSDVAGVVSIGVDANDGIGTAAILPYPQYTAHAKAPESN